VARTGRLSRAPSRRARSRAARRCSAARIPARLLRHELQESAARRRDTEFVKSTASPSATNSLSAAPCSISASTAITSDCAFTGVTHARSAYLRGGFVPGRRDPCFSSAASQSLRAPWISAVTSGALTKNAEGMRRADLRSSNGAASDSMLTSDRAG